MPGSQSAPPHIDDIVPGQPLPDDAGDVVLGVYEQEHIAGSPGLVFVSSRTASVVTRYWGTPPPSTGPQLHGRGLWFLGVSSCGNQAGHVGLVGYSVVSQRTLDYHRDSDRPLPWIDIRPHMDGFTATTEGMLTPAQESDLTAKFGAPIILDITPTDQLVAALMVWRIHIAVLLVLIALGALFVLRRHRSKATVADPIRS